MLLVDNPGEDTLKLYVTISPKPGDDKFSQEAEF